MWHKVASNNYKSSSLSLQQATITAHAKRYQSHILAADFSIVAICIRQIKIIWFVLLIFDLVLLRQCLKIHTIQDLFNMVIINLQIILFPNGSWPKQTKFMSSKKFLILPDTLSGSKVVTAENYKKFEPSKAWIFEIFINFYYHPSYFKDAEFNLFL